MHLVSALEIIKIYIRLILNLLLYVSGYDRHQGVYTWA